LGNSGVPGNGAFAKIILIEVIVPVVPIIPGAQLTSLLIQGKESAMQPNARKRGWVQRGALFLSLWGFAWLALGQCGCTTSLSEWVHNGFKVGPNFQAPPAPLPPAFIDEHDERVQKGNPNLATWWDVFNDPILSGLIQKSYLRNLTLRAAYFQIQQAREAQAIALGELFPQVQNFLLQYTHSEASINRGAAAVAGTTFGTTLAPAAMVSPVTMPSTPIAGMTPSIGVPQGPTNTPTSPTVGAVVSSSGGTPGVSAGSGRFFSNIATSLNLAWELDVWGLFRRNLEAADASLDQSVDNYDEQIVLLFANVATQYVELRTLQKRLELARKNVALQEPLVETFRKRYKAGIANSFPGYHQLLSNLENTRALIPQLEITLRQVNNQLCVLLGIPVRDLLPELGDGTAPDPESPSKREVFIPRPKDYSVVVGIPGDLLLSRPDVKASFQQLKIQSAEIGIAEAQLYPHIGVNGSIGLAADRLGRLFSSNSMTGSIGPSLTWNILNYGRLLANVRLQDAQYQQFVAVYQNTVLNANQDAENALVAYLKSIDQARHLKESADAAAKLTGYLVKQFKEGYLPPGAVDTSAFINQIFTAVNFQVTQQDAAAQAEGNIALNLILLYRAMGGGWQIRLSEGRYPCAHHCAPDLSILPVPPELVDPSAGPSAAPAEKLPPPRPVAPPVPGSGPGPAVEKPIEKVIDKDEYNNAASID
jgi:NodT family efflux transporter outer membrane factor (OMF) lipoprotein